MICCEIGDFKEMKAGLGDVLFRYSKFRVRYWIFSLIDQQHSIPPQAAEFFPLIQV